MLTVGEQTLADVTACRACGYLIVGLSPAGACPECGAAYDRRELVLFGRPGTWVLQNVFCLSVASLQLVQLSVTLGATTGGLWWWKAAMIVASALMLLVFAVRLPGAEAGESRVRLGRAGCATDERLLRLPGIDAIPAAVRVVFRRPAAVDGWRIGRPTSWARLGGLRLTPAGDGAWRLRAVRDFRWTPTVDVVVRPTPEQLAALRAFAGRFTTVEVR